MDKHTSFINYLQTLDSKYDAGLAAGYILTYPTPDYLDFMFGQLTDDMRESYNKWSGYTTTGTDWMDVLEATVDVGGTKMSTKPWASVNKSTLPVSAFLIVGDKDTKSTWHLPYRDETGNVNMGAVRAIWAVINGARGGADFNIPDAVKTKVSGWVDKIKKYTVAKKTKASVGTDSDMSGDSINESVDSEVVVESLQPESMRAWVTVIQQGWSKNQRYYGTRNLEQLSNLLMVDEDSRKVFLDHLIGSKEKDGRTIRDWAAQVIETKIEGGKLKALWEVCYKIGGVPDGWLFEKIQKFPNQVGISIDARAKLTKGMAPDGVEGVLVEEVVYLSSMDIVVRPAAGGRVEGLAESLLSGVVTESLQDMLKKQDEADKYWQLKSALSEALGLIWRDANIDNKEKKTKSDKVLDEFVGMMKKINLGLVFGEKKYEATEKIGTEKDAEGVKETMEIKTLADLKGVHSDLLEQFKKEVLSEINRDAEFKAMEAEKKALANKNAELTKTVETITVERDKAQGELKLSKREVVVAAKLAESELPEKAIDEPFKKSLLEAATDEDVDKLIKAKEEFVKELTESLKKGEPTGLGPKAKSKPKTETKSAPDDESVLAMIHT